MKLRRYIAAIAALLVGALGLSACGSSSSDAETVRIGTTDSAKKAWSVFTEKAKAEGYKVELVDFADYNTPNDALEQGTIDLNQFQHIKFLANYNNGKNTELTPIVATEIIPLALFWKGHTSMDGIDGESVAIPNDSTNQGRAINVLVQAGLVKLKGDDLLEPTPADVDTANSRVTVVPVDAARTPLVYGEGKPAVINNSFLDRAGIDPNSSIYADDPSNPAAEPYINAFVAKADRANDEKLIKLAELWHTPEVQAAVKEDSAGTSVQVQRTPEELKNIELRLRALIAQSK